MNFKNTYAKIKAFDFVAHRNIFFVNSAIITVLGAGILLFSGLNLGVDFKAGTTLDISIGENSVTKERAGEIITDARSAGAEPPILTVGGEGDNRVSARFATVLEETERQHIIEAFEAQYEQVSYEESTVDVEIAKEFATKTIWVVAIASIGIIIYVSIRFEWRFALAAILALMHDAFIVVSFFSIFRLEVNLPFVAAVLTIIGYSINDTIVTFDRIRENMKVAKLKNFADLADLVNQSVRQTLTRSINTALTVVFVALCLFLFGSESIRLFSLAMLVGLISGGYSSVFIASQVWILMKRGSLKNNAVSA